MTDPNAASLAILANGDAPPKAVQGALLALTRDLSPLGDDLPPALRRYTTAFIDELLETGKPAAAHVAAAQAVQSERDAAWPSSRGRARLGGAASLDCSSAPHRGLITGVLTALGRLTVLDPEVVPWLFEALKQWASSERRVALEVLRGLDMRAQARADGLAEVVRFVARFEDQDRGRAILRELVTASREDGAWMFALLAAIEAEPDVGERLLSGLYGTELGDPLVGESPAWLLALRDEQRRELERFAGSPVQAVRVMAVILLGQVPGAEVRPLALELLAAGGWAAAQIAGLLVARKFVGADVARAIAAARACPLPIGRQSRVAALIDALAILEEAQATDGPATVHSDGDWTVVLLPVLAVSPPVVHGDRLLVAYHRILRRLPDAAGTTDEDEFGFLDMSFSTCLDVKEIALPVALPPMRTGATGARRSFKLATQLGDALVCWLNTPFSEGASWGTRNYLFAFTPGAGAWEVLGPSPAPLAPGAREAALPSLGYGELIVWAEDGALRIAGDGTPYHLDDWEVDPNTRRDFDARRAAEARLPWKAGVVASGDFPKDDSLPLGDGRVIAGARGRIVDAWAAAATGRLYVLASALLPDGRVALTIRRFARDSWMRDVLVIAPIDG